MKKKQWLTDTKICLLSYGAKETEENKYELETKFGKLYIHVDEDIKIVPSVFMRFETLNRAKFEKVFQGEKYNKHSYKWNIHTSTTEEALEVLDFRLNNLMR